MASGKLPSLLALEFDLWHKLRVGSLSREEFRQKMEPVQTWVGELLLTGAACEQGKTRRTCENLRKMEVSLWTFVRVEGIEPTNNNAERPLRRAALWRRKSFGTQSEAGSRFVERILTVVITLRQQGRDVLNYLTAVCSSVTHKRGSICLAPDSS
jgi:transposase